MIHVPSHIQTPATMSRATVMQGQAQVSADPNRVLTTILGSCIATCLYDPRMRVGGMNHFLLAEPQNAGKTTVDENYGVYLMEVLINGMLAHGARKSRMRAHLYGGANLHSGMSRIGTANAGFARQFLQNEGIPIVHMDVGGVQARRVDFRPAHGQARCRAVEDNFIPNQKPMPRPQKAAGDVELF